MMKRVYDSEIETSPSEKRKIQIDDDQDEKIAESNYAAASKFMSIVNDDLLLEILIRIPDGRSRIQYSSVCKRWFTLISNQEYSFICKSFIDPYQHPLLYPYTLVIRSNMYDWHIRKPLYQLFSTESKILHGKSSLNAASYMSFFPWSESHVNMLGSSKDLLLLRRELDFYICNPLTRQWLALPKLEVPLENIYIYPALCGLVVRDRSLKVVLMENYFSVENEEFGIRVAIFCSETGQWNESTFLFMQVKWLMSSLIENNGILYGLCDKGILALDPFKGTDDPKRYRLIQYPVGFDSRYDQDLCSGVVQGQLRVLSVMDTRSTGGDGYILKIWELVTSAYDCDNVSWALVHAVKLVDTRTMIVAALHPINGDMIFLCRDLGIYQYNIKVDKFEEVGRFPEATESFLIFSKFALDVFSLVHPLWPTTIPSLPSV